MIEAHRIVNGLHVVALGETQAEADREADEAAADIREHRPRLGFNARPKGTSGPGRPIQGIIEGPIPYVRLGGTEKPHTFMWPELEYC